MKQVKTCIECGKEYEKQKDQGQKAWERRQFCSLSCFGKHAGNGHLEPYRMQKGTTLGEAYRFKKGETSGEANARWKGDNASYAAKHIWATNNFGKPQLCELCGTTENRMYHWANISGTYKRERSDWLRLCVPCHKSHDIKALGGKIKAREPIPQPSKICTECQTEFFKNPHLSKKQWETTYLCSRKCSSVVSSRKMQGNKNAKVK